MIKEVVELIKAVEFLTGDLEFMIEEGAFDEKRILKKINVVNSFKENVINEIKNF